MTQQLTSSPRKTLDEASFQRMLAAAYVVQEHNQKPEDADSNYPDVIAEVLRIQRIIRSGRSSLLATAKLICEQVQEFTRASGAAIGIVVGDELAYIAAIGNASRDVGRRAGQDVSFSAYSLQSGLILLSPSIAQDKRLPPAASNQTETRSLIAVPVAFEGKIVGVLEARFNSPNAFGEDDIRACEVMAQLVRELIVRAGHAGPVANLESNDPGQNSRSGMQSTPSGPATVVPQDQSSETPVDAPTAKIAKAHDIATSDIREIQDEQLAPEGASTEAAMCRGCGADLSADTSYCGKCGTEKTSSSDGPLQKKWASMWFMEQARNSSSEDEASLTEIETETQIEPGDQVSATPPKVLALQAAAVEADTTVAPLELRRQEGTHADSSIHVEWLPAATKAEHWLRRQWRVNRANFYLAGAAFLLILVLSGVGTLPDQSLGANPNRPKLTLFESMLVSFGLAEPPSTPIYKGNPDTPVWVDMHTALYYCPGSDLYGKTEGGKIASQRDAQLDQFEPAHRRACN